MKVYTQKLESNLKNILIQKMINLDKNNTISEPKNE